MKWSTGWWLVSTPLKNMKVLWGDDSQPPNSQGIFGSLSFQRRNQKFQHSTDLLVWNIHPYQNFSPSSTHLPWQTCEINPIAEATSSQWSSSRSCWATKVGWQTCWFGWVGLVGYVPHSWPCRFLHDHWIKKNGKGVRDVPVASISSATQRKAPKRNRTMCLGMCWQTQSARNMTLGQNPVLIFASRWLTVMDVHSLHLDGPLGP